MKRRIERFHFKRNPVDVRPDIIERIGDIRKKDRSVRIKKSQKSHRQHVIRTDADKNLLFFHMMIFCKTRRKRCFLRKFRIQAQLLIVHFFYRFIHHRRRRIRTFICIQFDNVLFLRLFPRYIRYDLSDIFFPLHLIVSFLLLLIPPSTPPPASHTLPPAPYFRQAGNIPKARAAEYPHYYVY